MCGIAGLLIKEYIEPSYLNQFWNSFTHRGPDGRGYLIFSDEKVEKSRELLSKTVRGTMLFHHRLSIIDLDDSGFQPFSSLDNLYHIVFNGEIYNYLELRVKLEDLGYSFKSTSDTEVLLKGYIEWGKDVLKKLIGMFSFAILDLRKREVFLARDFFGIKPLYYTYSREGFAFSSEIKSLLCLPFVKRKINPQALYSYFRSVRTDDSENTFYSDIEQLKPAHCMVLSIDNPSNFQIERYWSISTESRNDLSFKEAAAKLRDLFLKSIELHIRSDVPISFALSGGIDSSAIVSSVKYLYPNKDIHTFSYIANESSINEEKWIDTVNNYVDAKSHKVFTNSDISKMVDKLSSIHDEPIISTSIFAQYCIFQEIHKNGFKVTLDGQGADELLGGYRSYLLARMASLIKQGKKDEASTFYKNVSKLPGVNLNFWDRLTDYLLPFDLQKGMREAQGNKLYPSWLNIEWFINHKVNTLGFLNDYFQEKEVLKQVLYQALFKNNLPQLLKYEDTNSMLFSVESRVPFLSPELVEFVFSLPEEYLISIEGETKSVFREAMKGIVPSEVLNRKDKIGFQTPERNWVMEFKENINEIIERHIIDNEKYSFFSQQMMVKDWQEIKEGKQPYDSRVWRWINIIKWIEYNQIKTN